MKGVEVSVLGFRRNFL